MPGVSLLQTLQKIATVVQQLDVLTEDLRALRTTVSTRLERLEGQLSDVRERLARLEALRDADRAQVRAELRLTRLLSTHGPQLPEQDVKQP